MFDLASTGLGCGSAKGNDGERSSGIYISQGSNLQFPDELKDFHCQYSTFRTTVVIYRHACRILNLSPTLENQRFVLICIDL